MVAVALLAVLVPAALGGLTYVWCAPMARALIHACCPAASHASRGPSVEAPCCEGQRVAPLAMFNADVAPPLWVGAALFVSLIALAVLYAVGSEAPPAWALGRALRARAGPSPPLYLLHRSLLN